MEIVTIIRIMEYNVPHMHCTLYGGSVTKEAIISEYFVRVDQNNEQQKKDIKKRKIKSKER